MTEAIDPNEKRIIEAIEDAEGGNKTQEKEVSGKYPSVVEALYNDALINEDDEVIYEMVLTLVDNVNGTRDDMNIELELTEDIN